MTDDDLWWSLPGPHRFLAAVADDLRCGNNVVICLPDHGPPGLEPALRRLLDGSLAYGWNLLDVADADPAHAPARYLFDRLGAAAAAADDPAVLPNARGLVDSGAVAGHLYWLEGAGGRGRWAEWKRFLGEYAHACRPQPLLRRGVFCAAVCGDDATSPPAGDAGLAVHRWAGVVDHTDMLLFASGLLRSGPGSPLHRRLHAWTAAHLAVWDAEVCRRLTAERVESLDRASASVLRAVAGERNWCPDDCRAPAWERGMTDRVHGAPQVHSGLLALGDPDDELGHRVWAAQVAVVLPHIEGCRRDLLRRLAHVLRVPWCPDPSSTRGAIEDVRDLEIGHIYSQICNSPKVDRPTESLVRRLRNARNALAHLEPVPVADLLAVL